MSLVDAQHAYDDAVTTLKFIAFLTVEDPDAHIDALRDAVFDLEDAWNAVSDLKRQARVHAS